MRQLDDCVFCKIVRGEIPAIKVYEDELTFAFMDINPASEGHTLVICREHFGNVLEIQEPALSAVSRTVQRIARAIQAALEPDGIRVNQFNGTAAGQSVFHYHVHLVPIRKGRETGFHGRGAGDVEQIKAIAERLRAALEG